MFGRPSLSAALLSSIALVGCNECENGYKIKTEYKLMFWHESWHESGKDTLLDGAIRTTTWTAKNARVLTIRCFKPSAHNVKPEYDLRYQIEVPLLSRIGPQLEKAGGVEIVVSVDGTAIGQLKTRVVTHKHGISFLSQLTARIR